MKKLDDILYIFINLYIYIYFYNILLKMSETNFY